MSADRVLSPEAAAVVRACERLVSDLRHQPRAASARISISDLKETLPPLETVLTEMRRAEMLAAVATAAGAAATHEWVVTNAIRCPRCSLTAVDHALTRGAVPECGSGEPCTLLGDGHVVHVDAGNGGMRCTYCKTVYPATAPDTTADDSMRNLLSHVPAEEATEAMAEVAQDMTDEEKSAWLKRWGK